MLQMPKEPLHEACRASRGTRRLRHARDLADMGCGGGVCFASGFAETGDDDLQAALVEAAGNMPLLGPNCYGFLNYLDGAMLWPDQHGGQPVDSGVAIISQSSNIAINISMQARGLPIAYIACVGNQAQTSLTDMAAALLAIAVRRGRRVSCTGRARARAWGERLESGGGVGVWMWYGRWCVSVGRGRVFSQVPSFICEQLNRNNF